MFVALHVYVLFDFYLTFFVCAPKTLNSMLTSAISRMVLRLVHVGSINDLRDRMMPNAFPGQALKASQAHVPFFGLHC
jgi:hypothetical protein